MRADGSTCNEGKLSHCLSHVVMAVQSIVLQADDPDARKTVEAQIDELLRDAEACGFDAGSIRPARAKLQEFRAVVFPSASTDSDAESPEQIAGTFGLPEHPDEAYAGRVRSKYEEILPFFEAAVVSGSSSTGETE